MLEHLEALDQLVTLEMVATEVMVELEEALVKLVQQVRQVKQEQTLQQVALLLGQQEGWVLLD